MKGYVTLSPKQQWVLDTLHSLGEATEYRLTMLYRTEYPKFVQAKRITISMYDSFNMHQTLGTLISRELVIMSRIKGKRQYRAV